MKSTIQELAGVLQQRKNLEKEFSKDLYNESGNLHCDICNENHVSDVYSKCKNCKVTSNFWKGIQN